MATVTVTFEDIDDAKGEGVKVRVESDPPFPGPDATDEQKQALSDAQRMALRLTEMLTEEAAAAEGHFHDEHCNHQHCDHDHG